MASFITAGNATNGLQVSSDNTGILELRTGTGSGTTAVTIGTTQNATFVGNVGIGTSSPAGKFHVNTSTGYNAIFQTSGTTVRVNYLNDAASANVSAAYRATDFAWQKSDGSEAARIDSSGNLLVGTTSTFSGTSFFQSGSGIYTSYFRQAASSNPLGLLVNYSGASPNGTGSAFFEGNDTATARVVLRSNGGIANYSANNVNLSDRREKTNFAPAKNYLDVICAIPVQTFNYIDQNMEEDPGETLGVVAQDVQAVAPEMVMESNWGTKEEPKMRLSIYQTDLQYALMKSIQELKEIVDAQAAEIAALKGAA